MTQDDILSFLRTHKQKKRRLYGVTQIGLFGSHARRTSRDDSDTDILVGLDTEKKTLRNFFGLKRYLEESLGKPVDLGIEGTLKPLAKRAAEKDMIHASRQQL